MRISPRFAHSREPRWTATCRSRHRPWDSQGTWSRSCSRRLDRTGAASTSTRSGPRPPTKAGRCWRRRQRGARSEEHTSELQSLAYLVCRLLLEKKKQSPYENGGEKNDEREADHDLRRKS